MQRLVPLAVVLTLVVLCSPAAAHSGRRFQVQVIDNQLVAQGYITPGAPDDGGGLVRPYVNSIHDHWTVIPQPSPVAVAQNPGFDMLTPGPLEGYQLNFELVGASKWSSPPQILPPGTVPDLQPLDSVETISIFNSELSVIDTNSLGTLQISAAVPTLGLDADLNYEIGLEPIDTAYVLEWILSTNAPGIAPSDSVFITLSPAGITPAERLIHATHYLEGYLGAAAIPEPGTLVLLTLMVVAMAAYRYRS